MAKILGYIAASLDGYIADINGNLDWLMSRGEMTLGEHASDIFIQKIGTVVMGRTTYDWLEQSGMPWPYSKQRVIIVTSRPINAPIFSLEIRSNVDELIQELRALDDGDVWLMGGGKLQMSFIERGALDELELFLISEIIGGGTPLFPPIGVNSKPMLISAKSLGHGGARLHYRFASSAHHFPHE